MAKPVSFEIYIGAPLRSYIIKNSNEKLQKNP